MEFPETDSEGFVDRAAGTFLPVTQTINPLSNVPTDDHKALVVRLELQFYEYGEMESLIQIGISALEARVTALQDLHARSATDGSLLVAPLSRDDVAASIYRAQERVRAAQLLFETVRRPPKQQLNG